MEFLWLAGIVGLVFLSGSSSTHTCREREALPIKFGILFLFLTFSFAAFAVPFRKTLFFFANSINKKMLSSKHTHTRDKREREKSIYLMVFFCILKSIISGDDSVAAATYGHQLNSFPCKQKNGTFNRTNKNANLMRVKWKRKLQQINYRPLFENCWLFFVGIAWKYSKIYLKMLLFKEIWNQID